MIDTDEFNETLSLSLTHLEEAIGGLETIKDQYQKLQEAFEELDKIYAELVAFYER